MPVKKVRKTADRLPRRARAAHKTKLKTSKSSRSLSEGRQRSSVSKAKVTQRRPSVALQSDKRPSLNTTVYNLKGKVVGKVQLPKEIFGADINNKLMSQAVRVYLANQRLGTAKTKTRGEVKGSTRKIYRQKGTGRARHGSIRAPIFVKGGVVFGPKPRDFSLKLPQKMKRASLFSALSAKYKDGEIKVLTGLEKIEPKTKKAYEVVKSLSGDGGKVLLVTPTNKDLDNVYRSFRNIKGMNILSSQVLNTYEVLDNKLIILMKDAIDSIKSNFLKHE